MAIKEAEIIEKMPNSFLDDLLSFVEEVEVEENNIDVTKEGFSIETMEQANYITRKLKEAREEKAELIEVAKDAIAKYEAKIERWKEATMSPLENQEQRYLSLLEVFATNKLEGSNKKSLKLIEGTLAFRKQQDKYEYEDNVLLAYLEENYKKEYVNYKPSSNKAELKKAGKAKDGKFYLGDVEIPGITVTPQDQKFEVK